MAPIEDVFRKLAAWNKAAPIVGYVASDWRQDCDGRVISWNEYGKHSSYGWEIDHIVPVAIGGSDADFNLRARHWMGNSSAGGMLGGMLNNAKNGRW